jgi:DNA-binding Lrp family transcriptional regulator
MEKIYNDILKVMSEDCRYSAAKIAIMLGETEQIITSAIEKMENDGVIVKYAAIVDEEKISTESVQALIEVKVAPQKNHGFDSIAADIYNLTEVKSLYLMSGGYDLAVFVEGKTLRDVARFVSERLSALDSVLSTATHFILKKYKIEGAVTKTEDSSKRLAVHP